MRANWRVGLGAGVAIAAMALVGCTGGSNGATTGATTGGETSGPVEKTDLHIGYLTPLTGNSASTGIDGRDGAEVAVEVINASDLLPQYNLVLDVEDDASVPETGALVAQKLYDQGVRYFAGPMNSPIAIAEANVLAAAGEPALFIISGAQTQIPLDEQAGNLIFGLNHTNAIYAGHVLPWLLEEEKGNKIAVLFEQSDFGIAEQANIHQYLDGQDIDIVVEETFARETTDFSSILAKVRDSGATALYIGVAGTALPASIFTQADELGLDVTKYINSGLMSQALIDAGGEHVEGIQSGDAYFYTIDNPENAAFVEAFEAKFGKDPGALHSHGYDSVMLIAQAIAETGSADDVQAVADTLRASSYDVSRGTVTWDETGRAQTATYIITIEDGKLVLVDTIQ